MASSIAVKVACLTAMCVILGITVRTDAALTCEQVVGLTASCIPYVTGKESEIPPLCCKGIKTLNDTAQTTVDHQTVCVCLKAAALALPRINLGNLENLPTKCGVNLPYKLDPSIDCNKIQ